MCLFVGATSTAVAAVFAKPLLIGVAELTSVVSSADVLLLTLGNAELKRTAVYSTISEVIVGLT